MNDNDTFEKGKAAAQEVKNALKSGTDEVANTADVVKRDVRRGADRVSNALESGRDKVNDAMDGNFKSKVSAASDSAVQMARRTSEYASDAAEELQRAAVGFVRERPWSALALATLGGVVIAALWHRNRE